MRKWIIGLFGEKCNEIWNITPLIKLLVKPSRRIDFCTPSTIRREWKN